MDSREAFGLVVRSAGLIVAVHGLWVLFWGIWGLCCDKDENQKHNYNWVPYFAGGLVEIIFGLGMLRGADQVVHFAYP